MVAFYGTIDYPNETDFHAYTLKAGTQYIASVQSVNLGYTLPNPILTIYDGALNYYTSSDDPDNLGKSPSIIFEADDTFTFYLLVSDYTGGTGTYIAEIASFGSEVDPYTVYEPDLIMIS